MAITVEIEGMDALLATFKDVERGMLDFRQLGAWKGVKSVFYKLEKQAFSSEGSSGASGKWAALKPNYEKVKIRRWGKQPILTASGALYRSMTGGEGSVYEESAQELVIGSSIKYGQYHQTGTSKMKARPPLSFTGDQEKQLMEPIADKLKQLIQNARLRNLRG